MEIDRRSAGRVVRTAPARSPRRRTRSTRSSASCRTARTCRLTLHRRGSAPAGLGRPLALQPAGACRPGDFPVMSSEGLPGPLRHRHGRPDPADRQDPLRHLHRGDALLPERPLPARGGRGRRRRKLRAVATDGHRLALAEMPAPEGSSGVPGVIIPRKTVDRGAPPARRRRRRRRGALSDARRCASRVGPRAPDLQGDRRLVPRLRAGDPARQRPGADARQRALRRRGRPRLHHLGRADPRGEAGARARAG